jgi:hypothetical protein
MEPTVVAGTTEYQLRGRTWAAAATKLNLQILRRSGLYKSLLNWVTNRHAPLLITRFFVSCSAMFHRSRGGHMWLILSIGDSVYLKKSTPYHNFFLFYESVCHVITSRKNMFFHTKNYKFGRFPTHFWLFSSSEKANFRQNFRPVFLYKSLMCYIQIDRSRWVL